MFVVTFDENTGIIGGMSRQQLFVLLAVAMVLCAAYAITLHVTGQHAEASEFVRWAGGGLATILVLTIIFG